MRAWRRWLQQDGLVLTPGGGIEAQLLGFGARRLARRARLAPRPRDALARRRGRLQQTQVLLLPGPCASQHDASCRSERKSGRESNAPACGAANSARAARATPSWTHHRWCTAPYRPASPCRQSHALHRSQTQHQPPWPPLCSQLPCRLRCRWPWCPLRRTRRSAAKAAMRGTSNTRRGARTHDALLDALKLGVVYLDADGLQLLLQRRLRP